MNYNTIAFWWAMTTLLVSTFIRVVYHAADPAQDSGDDVGVSGRGAPGSADPEYGGLSIGVAR